MVTKEGTPFWSNREELMAYRLHLAWNIPSYHYCATTKNIAAISLEPHVLDESQDWAKPDQKGFHWKHVKTSKKFLHHRKILARVEIGNGCLTKVTLQIASKVIE